MSEPEQTVTFIGFVISIAHTAAVHFGDVRSARRDGAGRREPARGAADDRHPRAARAEDQGQPHRGGAPGARAGPLRAPAALRRRRSRMPTTARASSSRDRPCPRHVPRHRHLARRADDRLRLRVCTSDDPRDNRLAAVDLHRPCRDLAVLVDTATDLRAQALAFRLPRRRRDPLHAQPCRPRHGARRGPAVQRAAGRAASRAMPTRSPSTEIRRTFAYIFDVAHAARGGLPQLELFTLAGEFCLGRTPVTPVPLWHGRRLILGYRIGPFAYLDRLQCHAGRSVAAARGRGPAGARRAAAQAAPDAFLGERGAGGRGTAQAIARRGSRISPTICRMPPRARACPRAWNWHMMG